MCPAAIGPLAAHRAFGMPCAAPRTTIRNELVGCIAASCSCNRFGGSGFRRRPANKAEPACCDPAPQGRPAPSLRRA